MNIGDINIDSLYIGDIKALSGCIGSEVVWWDSGSTPTPPTPPEPVGPPAAPSGITYSATPLSFLMLEDGYVGLRCMSGVSATHAADALGQSKSLDYFIYDPSGNEISGQTLTISNQNFGQTELVFVPSGHTISFYAPINEFGQSDQRGLASFSGTSFTQLQQYWSFDGFYASGATRNNTALVYGNIMSLVLSEDEFDRIYNFGESFLLDNITLEPYAFAGLFYVDNYYPSPSLQTPINIVFPSNIEDALVLPMDDFVSHPVFGIYKMMFYGNLNMTHAPVLPATALWLNCYQNMFSGCMNLTQAPELPATTLTASCYSFMFSDCVSLTQAPELPATTLPAQCYSGMFRMWESGSSLNYIKCLATSKQSNSTTNWVAGPYTGSIGVSPTGTFIKHPNMTGWSTGHSGIPDGWTVEDAIV